MGRASSFILVHGFSWLYGSSGEEIELQEIVNSLINTQMYNSLEISIALIFITVGIGSSFPQPFLINGLLTYTKDYSSFNKFLPLYLSLRCLDFSKNPWTCRIEMYESLLKLCLCLFISVFSFRYMLFDLYFSGFILWFLVFRFRNHCFVLCFKSVDLSLVVVFCLFVVYFRERETLSFYLSFVVFVIFETLATLETKF
ncbi:hypothetical protein Gogos_017646, partial [Gossypium gossypioides]|nr:hypothetical protein [Gossypium gossypioides]